MPFDFSNFSTKAKKAVEHVKKDINSSLRTGRASAQILDPVVVEAYGSEMSVSEVANISTPDATLIVVTPWDANIIEDIEKGIMKAGLNLNPVVDGELIRIAIPPLTEETRKEMVKQLKQKIESGKVMLRNVRTDVKQEIEELEGTANISEDDIERDLEQLDKEVQKLMDELEALEERKENELMTV